MNSSMFGRSFRTTVVLMLTALTPLLSRADDGILEPYFSPGLQIGWSIPGKLFVAGQLTLGLTEGKPGFDELIYFPGATVGFKRFVGGTERLETYLDLQLSVLGFTGVGFGLSRTQFSGSDDWVFGLRQKAWLGAFGLIVGDRTRYADRVPINSIGLMGVFPNANIHIPPD